MTDDPSTNSGEWVCRKSAPGSRDCYPQWPHLYGGCGYVTPSPVQDSERPATNLLRHLADDVGDHIGDDDRTRILAAADWIDAQPAADQGPDLSEAAALLDEYDQSVHNLTRFGTVEAQTDHLLASERVAAFARRLLDREGGN